jgi:hypothetical protein
MQTPPAERRETSRLPTVCRPARVLSTNNSKRSRAHRVHARAHRPSRVPGTGFRGTGGSGGRGGQAIYFHRALSWHGAEHELGIYPREGHGLVERNHQLDLLRRTRAWFGRWLS